MGKARDRFLRAAAALLGIAFASCVGGNPQLMQPAAYVDAASLGWVFYSTNEGVYPSADILANSNNLFRSSANEVAASPADYDGKIGISLASRYYIWGTALAVRPSGYHQYQVGEMLMGLAGRFGSAGDDGNSNLCLSMAYRCFQSTYDNFFYQKLSWPWNELAGVVAYNRIKSDFASNLSKFDLVIVVGDNGKTNYKRFRDM